MSDSRLHSWKQIGLCLTGRRHFRSQDLVIGAKSSKFLVGIGFAFLNTFSQNVIRLLKRFNVNRKERKMPKQKACIEACQQCIIDCQNCLGEMLTVSSSNDCPKCCLECAEICELCVRLLTRGGKFSQEICKLCAEVCDWCADQCGAHEHAHCQKCAASCRSCAEACRQMAV